MFALGCQDKAGASNGTKVQPTRRTIERAVISAATLIPRVTERRLRHVLESIAAGPPQSVRQLAQEVNLSPAHLQRLFKQEMGVHISNILTESRLTNAAHLLCTTYIEVNEIAHRVGYRHHSSFVRAFQRRFGQAPRDYRRRPAA